MILIAGTLLVASYPPAITLLLVLVTIVGVVYFLGWIASLWK